MKIVHCVGWYFPDSLGGTEVYVAAVCRELARMGLDVAVASPRPGASAPSSYAHDSIPVFRYPIPAAPTRSEARGDVPVRGAEQLHAWLRDQRPDIVHFHTFVTGLDLIEVECARALGARVYVTSHSSALGYVCLRGTLVRWGTTPCDGVTAPGRCAACALQHRGVPRPLARSAALMPAPLSRLADRVAHPAGTALGLAAYVEARMERQRRMFDTVDTFYALTDAARRILLRNGAPERKVRVNRLGIDTYSLGPQVPLGARVRRAAQSLTVGYLGRFDPIKGLDDLLRAVMSLDSDVPVALDIRGVGDGRDAERVRARCEAAARKDSRIRVGAAVPRDGVRDLLESWDLLCCPGVSLEGGPTVALEAMAVGTPVIGTRLGGLAEVLQDDRNGKLVPPNDWRALAGIIRAAALDTSIVERWRTHLPRVRTMCDVTADYVTAYRE